MLSSVDLHTAYINFPQRQGDIGKQASRTVLAGSSGMATGLPVFEAYAPRVTVLIKLARALTQVDK